MEISTKLNVGEEAFISRKRSINLGTKECGICDSNGKVDIGGELFTCPRCRGIKLVDSTRNKNDAESVGLIIGIDIFVRADKTAIEYYKFDNGNRYPGDTTYGTLALADEASKAINHGRRKEKNGGIVSRPAFGKNLRGGGGAQIVSDSEL